MGFLEDIGSFKVGGSIDAQFRTDNALERIAIASGKQVGGFTSFLMTIEFIGNILLIVFSLFIISAILIIYTILFLGRVWGYFFPNAEQRKANGVYISDEELDRLESKFELTEDDIEEINNYH